MPTTDLHALIFDMDGLLLDTERIALRTFAAACRQFGAEPQLAVYQQCIGKRAPESRALLRQAFGPEFPLDEMHAHWARAYQADAIDNPVPVMAGVRTILEQGRELGVPMAVCTSTRQNHAVQKLALAGLLPHFCAIVSGSDVFQSKPDPEPYRLAAQRLGVAPGPNVVAFEDSDPGTRSAHAAGLRVFQIPDLTTPSDDVRALGHRIVDSLDDAARELFP